jgi:hypothetical protein
MGRVKSYYQDVLGKQALDKRDYPNRREDPWMDNNYRRGYHHGYSQALDDQKWGKSVIKFFNTKLTQWRYGKKPYKGWDEVEHPPNA